jgi:hypothetical protein
MQLEQWCPVVGFEDLYEVSDLGRVRSKDRIKVGLGPYPYRGRVLRPQFGRKGYTRVTLSRDGVDRTRPIHHIVTEAFLGPRPPSLQVRHLDGNPSNNSVTNLRYGTATENGADKARHGSGKGERQSHNKLSREQVREIRRLRESGVLARELGARFGVAISTVFSIANRRNWAWLDADERAAVS